MVHPTPFVGHRQTNNGERIWKQVSVKSQRTFKGRLAVVGACVVSGLLLEALENIVDHMTPSGRDTLHLRGVCHCTNSRPFAVSIVTKPRLWGDRVVPAQCRFTGFTRHSWMWVGRVNPRNQKAVNLWPIQCYVTKHAKDECRMVEAKLCLFHRWHLLTEHCV